ncbi:MAG: YcxB family protein [Fusobacteria bacterium]|nr:YcxB family protein [Fusobacteriota bacterium]
MAKEIITLQYVLKVEDQITYHKYLMGSDEVVMNTIKKNRMLFTIVIMVVAVVCTWWKTKTFEFTSIVITAIIGAILGYAISHIVKSITEKSYMKLVKKKISESRGNKDIPIEITSTKKGLHVVSEESPKLILWDNITEVVETKDQLLLFFGKVNAFIIPKRGLEPNGLSLFKSETENYCSKFKNRKNLK